MWTEPDPVIATAINSAITSTPTITTSTPTAPALRMATMRVEAIARNAWISSKASVISRAVCSSGPRPTSGMNAWLAIALSTATTAIPR